MDARARRQRILEAGAQVLSARGYHGASMRDVARTAGVGLATIYHHLAGKDDLLYQVEREVLEAAVASARAAQVARGARDRLRALVTDHVRRVLDRPIEAAAIAGRLPALRGERGRRLEALRTEYRRLVEASVAAVGRGPKAPPRETEVRALLLLGMADRIAESAHQRGAHPQPGRLSRQVLQVFLDGLRPKARARRP